MYFTFSTKDLLDPSLDIYNYKSATGEKKPRAGKFEVSKIKSTLDGEMRFPCLFNLMVGLLQF